MSLDREVVTAPGRTPVPPTTLLEVFLSHGGADERNAAVIEQLPLVSITVEEFVKDHDGFNNLADDLQGEGQIALIETIDRLASIKWNTQNLTAYLRNGMLNACREWLSKHLNLGMSNKTRREYEEAGKLIPTLTSDSDSVKDRVGNVAQQRADELREFLYELCRSHEERIFCDMRERGCKDNEIASELGISLTEVRRMRASLNERYQSALLDLDKPKQKKEA